MKTKSRHALPTHLGLLVAESICISAFVIEVSRALSGNWLSWAYVVEWPVLGAYAIYMWRRLLKDDEPRQPEPDVAPDDPRLAAWNEYLAEVHRHEQPGPS